MANDKATVWGGQIRLGRDPAANETLIGNADGTFDLSPLPSANIQTLLDGISNTQGSILYRGASAWTALSPGTAGQVLSTGGAGANPSWVSSVSSGPAFSAYRSSNLSVVSGYNKITFTNKEFDTNNCFASDKFTPNVAGYYIIIGSASYSNDYNDYPKMAIYKNGSIFKEVYASYYYGQGLTISSIISFNGSTDYVELYWYSPSNGTLLGTQQALYFQGHLARVA